MVQIYREAMTGTRKPARDWAFIAMVVLLLLALVTLRFWACFIWSKHCSGTGNGGLLTDVKRLLLLLGILVAILVLAAVALVFFFDVNRFRPTLEAHLTEVLHRNVKLGKLGLSILSGSIEANDLEIADDADFGKAPFLRAKAILVAVEMKPLIFEKKINVTGITIEKPEIALIQNPAGDWNYASLGASNSPPAPPAASDAATTSAAALAFTISRLQIADGSLSVSRTGGAWKPLVLENLNIEVKNFSPTAEFPYTLTTNVKGGGSIKLDGKAGPINATDASTTPVTVNFNVSGLDIAATGLANYAPIWPASFPSRARAKPAAISSS
jgi:AsmA protein